MQMEANCCGITGKNHIGAFCYRKTINFGMVTVNSYSALHRASSHNSTSRVFYSLHVSYVITYNNFSSDVQS